MFFAEEDVEDDREYVAPIYSIDPNAQNILMRRPVEDFDKHLGNFFLVNNDLCHGSTLPEEYKNEEKALSVADVVLWFWKKSLGVDIPPLAMHNVQYKALTEQEEERLTSDIEDRQANFNSGRLQYEG